MTVAVKGFERSFRVRFCSKSSETADEHSPESCVRKNWLNGWYILSLPLFLGLLPILDFVVLLSLLPILDFVITLSFFCMKICCFLQLLLILSLVTSTDILKTFKELLLDNKW